jgi:hypothetical protein
MMHSRHLPRASFAVAVVLLTGLAFWNSLPESHGQAFPKTRLECLTPPGGQAGTSVEVLLRGVDLDDIEGLLVSDSRLKVEKVPDPPVDPKAKNPPPPPIKYKITIPAGMPVGVYDVRAIGRWGISNPRAFQVGTLKEEMEKEPNNDVPKVAADPKAPPTAQKVELNTTINGSIGGKTDVDYYNFAAKKGQRIVAACASFSIDSQLNPLLELYHTKGNKFLASNRNYSERDAVLDYLIPEDGEYYVRLCQFAYIIGDDKSTFYRLTLSTAPWIDSVYPPVVEVGKPASVTLFGKNLPGGTIDPAMTLDDRPLEKVVVPINPPMNVFNAGEIAFSGTLPPVSTSVDGFEYRTKNAVGESNPMLLTFSKVPVVLDNGKNNTDETAQPLTLPCTVCGMIEELDDQDMYKFTAKKGDVYVLEGFADRLGIPVNLFCLVKKMGEKPQVIANITGNPEILNENNDRLYLATDDPKGRISIPEDGEYTLLVTTNTSYSRSGPRFVYRVTLQKEEPDFRVLLLTNKSDSAGGFTINQGSSQELHVALIRKDGFNDEVLLECEGLPAGVTCVPQTIGPKLTAGVLVLQAAGNAGKSAGEFKIKASATVDGKKVVRSVRTACLVWPSGNNVPAIIRLSRSICVAVREKGPYSLETSVKELEVPVGGNASFKVKINRNWPELKSANIALTRLSAPAANNGKYINLPNVNLNGTAGEAEVKFQVPNGSVPGIFNVVLQGKTKVNLAIDPKDSKKKKNVDIYEATPPVKVVVYDKVAELVIPNPKVSVKQGEEMTLTVQVKRLYNYKGEYQLQLVAPNGVGGISADQVKIPANANEAKIKIKVAKNAKEAAVPNFIIRASAKVENVTFNHDATFELTVTKAAASNNRPGAEPALAAAIELKQSR